MAKFVSVAEQVPLVQTLLLPVEGLLRLADSATPDALRSVEEYLNR